MLASDDANQEFAGARNPDAALAVRFYKRTTPNPFLSTKEGCPKFQDEDFIQILTPGRNDLVVDRPVEPQDKIRFHRQWAMFRDQHADDEQVAGTRLSEWPVLTRAQAEELRGKKFYTVEQIANCSDDQITALGMSANLLRQKARAYLDAAKNTAAAQAAVENSDRLDRENAELRDQLAELRKTVSDLAAGGGARPKRGRKKRELTPEQRQAIAERFAKGRADAEARRQAEQAADSFAAREPAEA